MVSPPLMLVLFEQVYILSVLTKKVGRQHDEIPGIYTFFSILSTLVVVMCVVYIEGLYIECT